MFGLKTLFVALDGHPEFTDIDFPNLQEHHLGGPRWSKYGPSAGKQGNQQAGFVRLRR